MAPPLLRGDERRLKTRGFLASWRTVASIGAVALVATACGSSGSGTSGASTAPIKIGVSLSLTGDFSADGKAFQQGYQLWAKQTNAKGGLLGRKVTLDIVNDASSPVQVGTNYQKESRVDDAD